MAKRALAYLRSNLIAFFALFFALGAGGGYALAAWTPGPTVFACADRGTGVLHVKTYQGACSSRQKEVDLWSAARPRTAWVISDAAGHQLAGWGARVTSYYTGTHSYGIEYTLADASGDRAARFTGSCAVSVTPDAQVDRILPQGVPIVASVERDSQGWEVYLMNPTTGALIQDGFSATINC